MRRLVLALGTIAVVATGCSQPPPAPSPSPAPPAPAQPLPDPRPAGTGPCPYLATSFVADANGQHVSKVQTSGGQPPSCFFYALNGKLQLTVQVYVGEAGVAKALVDKAAPMTSSNPANEPAGWRGGYERTDTGAVYAVSKAGAAVVVTTNQKQTVKARTVAKQTISALGL
ncbi:DUF2020 domain-containing protein [Amycolatopsis alkalitolerans]|uniref:DUF2020 domain-containing protein n=1 Tax=Amycolatopsis alkalitolerans TaxID=2547244 RepID=A0A5C4M3X8_9PSEU|nr:DUF2020 domain-containing protein [Amycolatopsis alkalitolerans]TNC27297.1 DUF2020 domain-containing protein [Amycolatopsis alkalitolerans]